jgi:hypothetical protein
LKAAERLEDAVSLEELRQRHSSKAVRKKPAHLAQEG